MLQLITLIWLLIIISLINLILNFNKSIIILINLELLLIAISLIFLIYSFEYDDLFGYLFSLFLLVVSACSASIGISLIILSISNPISIPTGNFNLKEGY